MVRFIVIDNGKEGVVAPRRIEINTDGDRLALQTFADLLNEGFGLESDRYTIVFDRAIKLCTTFIHCPEPTEVNLYREVDPDVNVAVLTTFKGEPFHSILAAGTTVEEYRRLVARKFLVRPPLQELFSTKLLMEDSDRLSFFAAGGLVRICLQVEQEFARLHKVFISVKRRREPGYLSFVMDDVETFDMLVGRLEREGEVREGEEVSFVSDGTVFDNWKTLGEYQLTHARLRIFE